MKTKLTKEQQEEFEAFLNLQMAIFEGNARNLALRIINKRLELEKIK